MVGNINFNLLDRCIIFQNCNDSKRMERSKKESRSCLEILISGYDKNLKDSFVALTDKQEYSKWEGNQISNKIIINISG